MMSELNGIKLKVCGGGLRTSGRWKRGFTNAKSSIDARPKVLIALFAIFTVRLNLISAIRDPGVSLTSETTTRHWKSRSQEHRPQHGDDTYSSIMVRTHQSLRWNRSYRASERTEQRTNHRIYSLPAK